MWLLNSYKNVTVLISVMKELKPGQETLARMDYLEEKTGFREKREKTIVLFTTIKTPTKAIKYPNLG